MCRNLEVWESLKVEEALLESVGSDKGIFRRCSRLGG